MSTGLMAFMAHAHRFIPSRRLEKEFTSYGPLYYRAIYAKAPFKAGLPFCAIQ